LPGVRKLIAIALAASCLGLVACGGDDDETTSTAAGASGATGAAGTTTTTSASDGSPSNDAVDELGVPSPPQAIERVLTSGDPKQACEELVTPAFVARAYGGADGCKAAIEGGGSADSVEVTDVERDGDTATAVAVPDGGPNSGEHIDVKLIREGGVWKVDDLHSNVPAGP
jgi:hypothetical protein